MKRKTSNRNTWQDHYTRKAQKEKYPARSVYKLQEIQKKYRLIRKGDRVLDLGCSPGSWLAYAADITFINFHMGWQLNRNRFEIDTNNSAALTGNIGCVSKPRPRGASKIQYPVTLAYKTVFFLDLLQFVYGPGRVFFLLCLTGIMVLPGIPLGCFSFHIVMLFLNQE